MPTRLPRALKPRATVTTLALAVPFVVAFTAARAPFADGLTFTYRVQSTAATERAQAQDRTAPSPSMLGTVRMSGANARLDFREGGTPMTQGGGYILIRGADQQLVFVSAKDKQAMVVSADAMGSGFGALTNNALVKITVRDPHFTYEDLGPGDRILGYPTRHVRLHTGSTMETRVLGRTRTSTDSSVSEQWIAQRPAGIDAAAMTGWSKAFGMGVQRTNPELAQLMTDYRRKYGDGLALRTVSYATRADDRGQVRTDTVRMEVTELSRGAIDPSVFEIPADYKTVDMRQMAAAADSARRAGGDTASAGDKPADAVRKGLGGLLRRGRP